MIFTIFSEVRQKLFLIKNNLVFCVEESSLTSSPLDPEHDRNELKQYKNFKWFLFLLLRSTTARLYKHNDMVVARPERMKLF